MDYVLPNELVDGMIAAGGKKSTVSVKNLLIRGFYSGAILGLAVILALTVGITVKAPFVGSLLFPFGFASIVLFGMELVTGNFALLPMAHLGRQEHLGCHVPQLGLGVDRQLDRHRRCGRDHGHQPHQRHHGWRC